MALRSILIRNELSSATQLSDLSKCLTEAGLTFSELFDVDFEQTPDDSPDGDAECLAELLVADRRINAYEHLALSLGWTLERVDQAAVNLENRLAAAGLRVHRNATGLAIRPVKVVATDVLQKLMEFRDDNDGINRSAAEVLYSVFTGSISSRELGNNASVQLGSLNNRGATTFGEKSGERVRLSVDCAFAFDVTQ